MSVTLTSTRIRPDDNGYDVVMVGINYASNRLIIRVRFQSGDERDVTFEGARLLTIRTAVSQFSGLRLALEQYLAANEPDLGGTAT